MQLVSQLLTGYVQRLQAVVCTVPINNLILTQSTERISIVIKFYHHEQTASVYLPMLLSIFQHLDSVLRAHPTEGISEKICRCYRFAIKHYTVMVGNELSVIIGWIVKQFTFYPVSSFLYAAATIVSTYSLLANHSFVDRIYDMIWQLSTVFFAQYSSLEHFQQKPDVVEEYYYVLAKLLQYIPFPYIQSHPRTETIFTAALTGLAINHREAQKGILLYLERYLQMAKFWPSGSIEGQQAIQVVIQDRTAGRIVKGLMVLLSGRVSAYAIDESNGCIADVLWLLKKRFEVELQVQYIHNSCSSRAVFGACGSSCSA
jgi:hypothetical protein